MDKRQHTRSMLSQTSVFDAGDMAGYNDSVAAEIINISSSGACIRTSMDLHPGRVIRLKLDMKDVGVKVPCLAEVRWADSIGGSYNVGVQFLL